MTAAERIAGMSEIEAKEALLTIVNEDAKMRKELREFMLGFGAERKPLDDYALEILREVGR